MEIQQLKNFYVIAQCESLTKAAQKLHTSQPSLSRSLYSLEEELGVKLFDRVGRNIVLNDTGRFALERVIKVLNSVDAVRYEVNNFAHDDNLSVDLYSPVPMGNIEGIIAGFKKAYPDIRLRIASWPSERLKTIQPNITFFASPNEHKGRNYLYLGDEEVGIVASRTSHLAGCASVRLADLADENWVRVLPSSLYEITSRMFLEAGFEPNVVAECQDYNQILAHVATDFGLALAPSITWFGGWDDKVVYIPIEDVHRTRHLYLKWPENTIMNWATLRFRDYLIDYFNTTFGFDCSL